MSRNIRNIFNIKRLFIVLVILFLSLYAVSLFVRPQLGEWVFDRAVSNGVLRNNVSNLPDGMHVALCGTGSPLADPTRAAACSAVIIKDQIFIVDIGGGAFRKFQSMGLPAGQINAVFLTHFHSDHIDGLGELATIRWVAGHHTTPLPVYGPKAVTNIVAGFNAAYSADAQYRTKHHGESIAPSTGRGMIARDFDITDQKASVVFDDAGIKITAFKVDHSPVSPSVGYRFDYMGRSIVFSGDTAVTDVIPKICNGCDIMVHEVLKREMTRKIKKEFVSANNPKNAKIMHDIEDYHTSPVEAALHAKKGKAKLLILSHIVPALPSRLLYEYYLKDVDMNYDGDVVIGEDGMIFSLPPNSKTIESNML